MTKKPLPAWAVLAIITLVAALALGGTYEITKGAIAQRKIEEDEATRTSILPTAASFVKQENAEGLDEDSFFFGMNEDGQVTGYTGAKTVQGFGGQVEVTVGTDTAGCITGVRVGGQNFSETAGLGAKTREPAFYEQFKDKVYPVDLKKNGGEIDAVTSATVTSSAVVRAVNDAVKAMSKAAGFEIDEPVSAIEELGNGQYAVSGQGVTGAFPIVITLDDNGAVEKVDVRDSESATDVSFLAKVQENEAYLAQFAGKNSLNPSEADTVSGATVSSTSINEAVSSVLLYVNDPSAYAAQQSSQKETSIPEEVPVLEEPAAKEPVATEPVIENGIQAEAKGLTGTFDVTVQLDENGAVAAIQLGEASTENDAPFLNMVKTSETFLAQFIGKSGTIEENSIDTVAGATTSSKAVIAAVNEILSANAPATEETPAEEPAAIEPAIENGIKAEAKGLTGTFDVTVQLDENGAVAAIQLGEASTENDAPFLNMVKTSETFLAQFVGKSGTIEENSIDTVAGATTSSKAVIAAVNEILAANAPSTEETPAEEPTATEPAIENGIKAEAKGLTGTFDVTVQLDENGAVAAIQLGEASTENDAPFLNMVKTSETFLAQFVGKSGTIEENSIDTVAGATTSSKAVIAAVNEILSANAPSTEETPAEEPAATEPAIENGIKAEAKGLTGTFDVTVLLDESGAVAAIQLGEASTENDAPFLNMVKTSETFLAQFIGKSGTIEENSIDTVAGATTSSKAVIAAVNEILQNAK